MTVLISHSPFKTLPLAVAAAALSAGGAGAQSAPALPPAGEAQLSTVEIVGRTDSGTYQAQEAAGAKTDLPLRELPQSVRVITRQAIDYLGATRLDEVLDYLSLIHI